MTCHECHVCGCLVKVRNMHARGKKCLFRVSEEKSLPVTTTTATLPGRSSTSSRSGGVRDVERRNEIATHMLDEFKLDVRLARSPGPNKVSGICSGNGVSETNRPTPSPQAGQ
jgi:hypothetical protein